MSNFFTDNSDIQFYLDSIALSEMITLHEDGFKEADDYPHAPRDVEDALDGYRQVLELVGEEALDFIEPRAESIDLEGNLLEDGKVQRSQGFREVLKRLSQADLMGFTLPRRFGGLYQPNLIYAMATEIVSRGDASVMNIFGLQGIAETINDFASEDLKAKYLPRFASGEVTGAMALTEPDAGSDLQAVSLKATPADDDTWRLSGVKRFITNGCGEVLLVLARSEPGTKDGRGLSVFLCEGGPEIKVRRLEDKLGIHGSPTCELQFNEAPAYLIGRRKLGLIRYVMSLMNGARVAIASQSLGIAEAAFRVARAYAEAREQFGRRINQMPAVQELLASMAVGIQGARALTYETARLVDIDRALRTKLENETLSDEETRELRVKTRTLGRLLNVLTPMCKYHASELACRVAHDAISVMGGSGYMKDYPAERHLRDARITSIYEGTTELQVVGALPGIMAGALDYWLDERPLDDYQRPLAGLAKKLVKERSELAKAVAYLKDKKDQAYTDLRARDVVDIASNLVMGQLLLEQAKLSREKRAVATKFITESAIQTHAHLQRITSGARTTLTHFPQIVGESND